MNQSQCEFIRAKIVDVEKSIKAREQSRETFLEGTDEEWIQAAKLHSSTIGKSMTRSDRVEASQREGRILRKLDSELAMFNAVLESLLSIP